MSTFQQTYDGWKSAVKRKYGKVALISFYGDKDLAGAQLLDSNCNPVLQVGEWDGSKGEVFDTAN